MFQKLSILMALLAMTTSVFIGSVTAQSDMEIPVYDITITDEGLEIPDDIAPGIAAFNFDNSAREESNSGAMLFQLAEGVTLEAFFAGLEAAMTSDEAGPMDEIGTIRGGSWIEPGASVEIIYDLDPGQYVILEFVREVPAIAQFEISGDMEEVVDSVVADVVVDMVDYAYMMPNELDSGEMLWELTNSGEEEHEVAVIQILDDNLAEEDIMEFLNTGEEPSEDQAQQLFSFIGLPPGGTAWMNVDLEPGRYLLICFIESPDGQPHFHKGMLLLLNVN